MKKGLTFPLHLTIILIVRWSTRLTNELNGGIAQLGERLNGIQEVSGSIPLISTKGLKSVDFRPFSLPVHRIDDDAGI